MLGDTTYLIVSTDSENIGITTTEKVEIVLLDMFRQHFDTNGEIKGFEVVDQFPYRAIASFSFKNDEVTGHSEQSISISIDQTWLYLK